MRAVAVIDGEHYAAVVAGRARGAAARDRGVRPRRRHREAARRRGVRRPARGLGRGGDRRARARRRARPLGRARARAARRASGSPRACSRCGVPYEGADFRLRPAALRADRHALARRDRHRQARRQDGGDGPRGARGLARPAASSSSRWAAAGRPSPRSSRCGRRCADLLALSRARAARRLGPPRDRRADRGADGRLPPLRRRSRGRGRPLERARRRARSPRRSTRT